MSTINHCGCGRSKKGNGLLVCNSCWDLTPAHLRRRLRDRNTSQAEKWATAREIMTLARNRQQTELIPQ